MIWGEKVLDKFFFWSRLWERGINFVGVPIKLQTQLHSKALRVGILTHELAGRGHNSIHNKHHSLEGPVFTKHSIFVMGDNDDDLTHNSRLAVNIVQKKISNSPEACTHTYTHTSVCMYTIY